MDGEEFDAQDRTKWILSFRDKLIHELDRPGVWPTKVEVYLDKDNIQSGNVPYQIKDTLSRTLVFVCLVSDNYWRRPYCVEEFATFQQSLKSNRMFPKQPPQSEQRRMIPVLLTPLNDGEMSSMRDLRHYEFYDKTTEDRFSLDRIGDGCDTMRQLAVTISGVLRDIRGPGGILYGDGGKAFVSFTPELEAWRIGLRSELEHFGVLVKPEQNRRPATVDEVATFIQGAVDEFAISIHGIDEESVAEGQAAPLPECEAVRLMQEQYCQRRRPEKILLWAPDGSDASSERYNEFLKDIQAIKCPGFSLCDQAYPDFRGQVFSELSAVDRTPRWTPRGGDILPEGMKGLYLLRQTSDARDDRYIAMLGFLKGLQSVKVWESADPDNTDPAASRLREEWILSEASSVLVFGSVDSVQFVRQSYRGKLKNWKKASTSLGFYLAMPDSDFRSSKCVVFGSNGPFDKDKFITALGRILPGGT